MGRDGSVALVDIGQRAEMPGTNEDTPIAPPIRQPALLYTRSSFLVKADSRGAQELGNRSE